MRFLILFFISFIIFSCKAKDSTSAGLESDLKLAMQNHLYQPLNNDSSTVKYSVEKVAYFADKDRSRYVCDFTVHMKTKTIDTTGIMRAYISQDLKTVKRVY